MLLLGLDDFGVGPTWKSRSELNVVDLRELLHAVEPTRSRRYVDGGLKFDSRAEVHMACSILDLSWRTCDGRDRLARGATGSRAVLLPSKIRERMCDRARAASSRPGDGPAAPRVPHRRGRGLQAEHPSGCLCNPTPPLHRVAERDLHFMYGPAGMLIRK